MGIYEKRPARTQSDRSNREGLIYIFEVGFLDLISQSWYRSGEKNRGEELPHRLNASAYFSVASRICSRSALT